MENNVCYFTLSATWVIQNSADKIIPNPFNCSRCSSDIEPSHPWVRYVDGDAAAASIFGLVILILILAIPISMLVIDARYRDLLYCSIEPHISRFLIVHGSVLIIWIILTIMLSIMRMFSAYTRSIISVICVVMLRITIIVRQIFSIVRLIVGSFCTFSIRNRVEFIINYPINFQFYSH
ncbi:unnamed protein product [Rotaria socialis]|uniref:Uncharacterized protein n=1 Tax=Rotaria socialis TaxID=392032 RepID=A0A821RWY3_9BILA|nr:unnamed protein product [Rotaria socialis]